MTSPETGRVVIVTGGTRGIGRAIATTFLEGGWQVVTCGRREPSEERGDALFVSADIREPSQIDRVVCAATDAYGRIDALVNNAGGAPHALVADSSPSFAEKIIALNLTAPLVFSRAVHAVMQEQDSGGCIVNIASVSGTRPSPGTAAYGAAKAGLINLTSSLAVEWAPKVRVNCVVAGPVITEQAAEHFGDDEGVAAVGKTIPLGRLAEPADIAQAVAWLVGPASSYVTGAQLLVHGGGERPLWMGASNAESLNG